MFTPAFRRFVWAGCALFAAAGTPACTLFGAVGEGMVEGGGTLAAKTRDEHPGPQRFDIAVPSKGYAYLGLFTGDKHRFNMGFNEKGLFLARSTSGSLPRKERLALPHFFKHRLSATDWIMQHYASVDEVLAHREVFVEPVNYLLADRTKPDGVQTLAAIAVSLPSSGNPSLNLTWRTDPNNPRAMDSLVCSVAPEDFKMGTAAFRKKCSAMENHP